LSQFGVLVSGEPAVEIEGAYPVWTASDLIAYQGCNNQNNATSCGIYLTSAQTTRDLNNKSGPIQLTQDASDIPADTTDNLIAFTTYRDGDWEAYVMNLDGSEIRNISNSRASNDGLPTISPDGNWIAFVSDRDDEWAVWVAPVSRGPAQKLFVLPVDAPWGDDGQTWLNERISWGP
jgi:Tol biopolymer transport system component